MHRDVKTHARPNDESAGVGGVKPNNKVDVHPFYSNSTSQYQQLPLHHSRSQGSVKASNMNVPPTMVSGNGNNSGARGGDLASRLLSSKLPVNKDVKSRDLELDHMELNADDLVAKLVDEEPKNSDTSAHLPTTAASAPAGFLPLPDRPPPPTADTHQWYYTDPQVRLTHLYHSFLTLSTVINVMRD